MSSKRRTSTASNLSLVPKRVSKHQFDLDDEIQVTINQMKILEEESNLDQNDEKFRFVGDRRGACLLQLCIFLLIIICMAMPFIYHKYFVEEDVLELDGQQKHYENGGGKYGPGIMNATDDHDNPDPNVIVYEIPE